MFRRMWRWLALFCLLAGLLPLTPIGVVMAGDAVVTSCTQAAFNTALATALNGGGTITFSCAGTISFTTEKTITSGNVVVIDGAGQITLDGGDTARLFKVDGGATLELRNLTLSNGAGSGGAAEVSSGGTLRAVKSTFDSNGGGFAGGALNNEGGVIELTGSTFTGNSAQFGGAIDSFGTLTITASTFSGNSATTNGGTILNNGTLTVRGSTFNGNSARSIGGAIANLGGTTTVETSTFTSNSVNTGNSDADYGGAIFSESTLTVTASTFSANSADYGGAIANLLGTTTVVNGTFSGNNTRGNGGAIYNQSTLAATASTISHNNANISGGGISNHGGTATIVSSIVAHNTATTSGRNCLVIAGAITSQGSNLSDDATCPFSASGDIQNSASVNLVPLAANGGPTQTMLLDTGSAAIDAVSSCGLSSARDQRGINRPQGSACDIGAVEVGGTVPVQIVAAYNTSGPIPEGGSANLEAVAYGPAGTNLDYDFDCDNNGSYEKQGGGTGSLGTANCSFSDNGSFTVGVRVCDATNGANCDTDTMTVSVTNVPPAITNVSNNGPVDEGSPATITVTATDPAGVNDPLTYSFDCDNNGSYEIGPQAANNAQCLFADNGSFTVGVRVSDGDGGTATSSTDVTVNNVSPVITNVSNNGPVNEGSPATITVTATDPAGVNDPLTYSFDCDNNGSYEIGPQAANNAQCLFADNGSFTVGVEVSDDDSGTTSGSTVVTVVNVAPTVNTPVIDPSPSNEGQSVVASATFSDPGTADTHSCTVDYGDGPVAGTITPGVGGGTCTGPAHTYLDDDIPGTASDAYTITVVVTDDEDESGSNSVSHTVVNVAPVIENITTNAPVPQGQPALLTVTATDQGGAGDPLTYSFDCDNDGTYETPGIGNQASCPLDPGAASTTFGVQVEDDDLGVTTGSITVSQTIALCASYLTGALSAPGATGCPAGTRQLTLPAAGPTTLCISNYTGSIRWSPSGQCTK